MRERKRYLSKELTELHAHKVQKATVGYKCTIVRCSVLQEVWIRTKESTRRDVHSLTQKKTTAHASNPPQLSLLENTHDTPPIHPLLILNNLHSIRYQMVLLLLRPTCRQLSIAPPRGMQHTRTPTAILRLLSPIRTRVSRKIPSSLSSFNFSGFGSGGI